MKILIADLRAAAWQLERRGGRAPTEDLKRDFADATKGCRDLARQLECLDADAAAGGVAP